MIENDYEVVVADTRETRRIHHRIRYQVYCLETGFEDPGAHPGGEETDLWDERSVHFLVRHIPSEQWIGTMRLVPTYSGGLPFQGLMGDQGGNTLDHIDVSAWEISRVCVPSRFRRQHQPVRLEAHQHARQSISHASAGGVSSVGSIHGAKSRPPYFWSAGFDGGECLDSRVWRGSTSIQEYYLKPGLCNGYYEADIKVDGAEVIWAMFKAAILFSSGKDATSLYFLVRPALARIIQRGGFSIQRVGGPCQYRGLRFAYRASLQEPANMLCSDDKPWYTESAGGVRARL